MPDVFTMGLAEQRVRDTNQRVRVPGVVKGREAVLVQKILSNNPCDFQLDLERM
jgi:hypothetical protein